MSNKSIFVTGMGRSGTTLLEKMLCNHNKVSMLSQPFPFLFIELKKEFLNTIGLKEYYVLNNSYLDSTYDPDDFLSFIDNYEITGPFVSKIFEKMQGYSGQLTKTTNIDNEISKVCGSVVSVYNTLVQLFRHRDSACLTGSKEILCEEYLPYFIKHGVKCIVIIRDPRDVLASANYSKKECYFGGKKPTLFILRAWRKSYDYINLLKGDRNFFFMKYEDLVTDVDTVLDKLTTFLDIEPFQSNSFKDGIKDQKGEVWSSNSSFVKSQEITRTSIASYKNILSKKEIQYTECICSSEMDCMGYKKQFSGIDKISVINNFEDKNICKSLRIDADYSSKVENKIYEINRGEK